MIAFKMFFQTNFLKISSLFFIVSFTQIIVAQNNVLLTIDNQKISVNEFEHIFNKNRDVVFDSSQLEINNYLDLFINFKLKLIDARKMGLDTTASYKSDLSKYRSQLVEPFLKDEQTVNLLAKEAYNRLEYEINASHILFQLPVNSVSSDTLDVYNQITTVRNKILQGTSFETATVEFSQDPSAKDNKGNLGYFTAFNMVYPFETACYNTNVGEISNPFRTKFGYHIVKINDKRPSKGEVEVSHIMLNNSEDKLKVNEIYEKLINGASFETFAKQYSVDQNSAQNGGKMAKFGTGKLVKEFEDVAFSLQEGQISKPFKTIYGWHIVKLNKRYPLLSYQELENELKIKVQNDLRSEIITKSLANKLKSSYKFVENKDVKSRIANINSLKSDDIIFSINKQNVLVKHFQEYINQHRNNNIYDNYDDFIDFKMIEFHKNNLENENPQFANIMKEYEEGLLLFEILQHKIWNYAERDTAGLKKYFDKHKSNYNWEKRFKGTVISCPDKTIAESIIQYLKEDNSIENIKKSFTKYSENIEIKSGIFEQESLLLPKSFEFIEGISKIYNENGKQKLVVVDEILNPTPKTFEEAKGMLINDFQQYIDQQWIDDLRKRIKVKIDKKALNKLISKYYQQ